MKAKILGIMLLTSLLCGCGNAATTGQSKPTATTTATSTSTTVTSTDTAAAAPAADTQTTAAGGAASQTPAATQAPAANGSTDSYYNGMTKQEWEAFTQTDQFKNDMAEQSAGYTVLAAVGDGFMIASSEKVFDGSGTPVYRVGVKKIDGSDSTIYYYYANENYCLTEAQWKGTDTSGTADAAKQDAQAQQTWEQYYKSDEHKQLMDSQAASDYVLNCVGSSVYMTASCDLVYDSNNNAVYRVGVKPLDPNVDQIITFYYTNGNYCITEAQWFGY